PSFLQPAFIILSNAKKSERYISTNQSVEKIMRISLRFSSPRSQKRDFFYLYSRGARKARGSTGYHSICFPVGHKK
ncbi:hypothetical protein, partial [uncultured Dialister sp.]|uniref:hypothetical protein n=1 Tax=uncultured Dialister sp. TaxID=278064 RepID=UPI0027DB40E3